MATNGIVDNYDPAKVLPIIRSVGNLEIATSTWLLSPLKDHTVIAAKSFAKLYSCRLSQSSFYHQQHNDTYDLQDIKTEIDYRLAILV